MAETMASIPSKENNIKVKKTLTKTKLVGLCFRHNPIRNWGLTLVWPVRPIS